MTKDLDMINTSLYDLVLFIINIADKFRRFKFVVLSHFSSSDLVFVVIVATKKLGKLQREESNLGTTEIDRGI